MPDPCPPIPVSQSLETLKGGQPVTLRCVTLAICCISGRTRSLASDIMSRGGCRTIPGAAEIGSVTNGQCL